MAGEWEKLNEKVRAKRSKKDPPFNVLKNHRCSQSQQQFTGCIQEAIEMEGRFPFSPKIPEISVRNGTDQFGSVRLEYLGTPLKVVHFDRSGHFGRSDRIVPFHFRQASVESLDALGVLRNYMIGGVTRLVGVGFVTHQLYLRKIHFGSGFASLLKATIESHRTKGCSKSSM